MNIQYDKLTTIIKNMDINIYSTQRDIYGDTTKFKLVMDELIINNIVEKELRSVVLNHKYGVISHIVRVKNLGAKFGYFYRLTKKGFRIKRYICLMEANYIPIKAQILFMETLIKKENLNIRMPITKTKMKGE